MSKTPTKKVLSLKDKTAEDNAPRIEERLHKVLAQAGRPALRHQAAFVLGLAAAASFALTLVGATLDLRQRLPTTNHCPAVLNP